jgi:hypothetical protein
MDQSIRYVVIKNILAMIHSDLSFQDSNLCVDFLMFVEKDTDFQMSLMLIFVNWIVQLAYMNI